VKAAYLCFSEFELTWKRKE